MRNRSSLFFYSPFSEHINDQKENQTVFLQFFLNELFSCIKAQKKKNAKEPSPFFWTKQACCFEKLKEHSTLLQHIFPNLASQGREIEIILNKDEDKFSFATAKIIFSFLFPFIEICKQNPSFIFFLLKHQKEIGALLSEESTLSFLERLCHEDIGNLSEKVSTFYLIAGNKQVSSQVQKLVKKLV